VHVHFHSLQVKFVYQGHRVKVKVTVSKKRVCVAYLFAVVYWSAFDLKAILLKMQLQLAKRCGQWTTGFVYVARKKIKAYLKNFDDKNLLMVLIDRDLAVTLTSFDLKIRFSMSTPVGHTCVIRLLSYSCCNVSLPPTASRL